MRKKIFLMLLLLGLPLFLLSFVKVTVDAQEMRENAITVNYSSAVDEQGGLVIGDARGEVVVDEENTFYGNTNSLQVSSADEGYAFSFYMEKGFVLSFSSNYTFRVVDDHQFIAFFRPVDKSHIVVVDANNKHLGSLLVDEGTILDEEVLANFSSKLNNPPGYNFVGWNVELPLTVSKGVTVIKAVYASHDSEFTVRVFADGELTDTKYVPYGKMLTLEAPEIEGKHFSHWSIGNQIISYNPTHKISVYSDFEIHANYTTETVEPVGLSYLSKDVVANNTIIYLLLQSYIPQGYNLIEQGLIYINSSEQSSEPITLESQNVQRIRALRFSPQNEFAVSINTVNHHYLYARGYLVLSNGEHIKTIYSEQLELQFKYNIDYHLDGGTNHPNNKNVYSVYEEVELLTPTKTGYNFIGWFNALEGGEEVTTIPVGTTGEIDLYARWEIIEYTISYNLDGGTLSGALDKFTVNDLPYVLPIPTKVGYNFVGWFTAQNGGTQVTEISKDAPHNVVVYARWELANYTLTLNLDGGSFTFASKAALRDEFFRDLYKFFNPNMTYQEFVHGAGNTTGYTGQWFLNSNFRLKIATKNNKSVNDSLGVFANSSLYNAKWLPFFDFLEDLIKEVNPTQSFWSDIDTGTLRLNAYFSESMFANKTQTPSFAPVSVFTINSGDIYLPVPNKAGYRFLGWYTTPDFSGEPVTKIVSGTTQNVTLYAKWEALTVYNVTYELDGGTLVNPITTYTVNNLPMILGIPEKEQHLFLGWYDNPDFNGNPITELGLNTTGNVVLYAKWEAPTEYNITYNLNGGMWGYPSKEVIREQFFRDLYNFINPTESYEDFVGSSYAGLWHSKDAYNAKLYTANVSYIMPGSNIFINHPTYNVKWLPLFDLIDEFMQSRETTRFWASPYTGRIRLGQYFNNSTFTTTQLNTLPDFTPKVINFTKYDNDIYLNIPYRQGYKFGGWYTNPEYSGDPIVYIPSGTEENIELYAKWNALTTYTVTYNLDGGTLANPINSFTEENLPITLPTPTKDGYIFQGWYTNSSLTGNPIVKIPYPTNSNVVLYAKWQLDTIEEFTITLHQERNYTYAERDILLTDLLTDLYNYVKPSDNLMTFMHGAGKTSGYNGTWYSNTTYKNKIYDGTRPSAPNASKAYFVYQPQYYEKWMPFFDFIDSWIKSMNSIQFFWGSGTYTGFLRLSQYITGTKPATNWTDAKMREMPTFPPIVINYTNQSSTIVLPALNVNGKTFLGWFTEQNGGQQVTQVPAGSTGNKVYYARWA